MTQLTFSNASNAVRGFRTSFPGMASFSNDAIRAEFIDSNSDGTYTINIEVVADAQQERLGVVSGGAVEGVPMLRRSVAGTSTAKARALFASLPAGTSRKDALDIAVRAGIAFYTARTQYSRVAHGK